MIQLFRDFTRPQMILMISFIIIGVVLRWYGIETRPLHHDESLHAIYGRYFFENPDTGYYKYDPMLHGPFLYNVLPYIYSIVDYSKFAIRFYPALIGSFFILLPLFFKRFLKTETILYLTAFIALSPTLTYWSRFLRHDYFVIASLVLSLSSFIFIKNRLFRILGITIGFTLTFTIKENAYVTVAILLGFLTYDYLFQAYRKESRSSSLVKVLSWLKENIILLPFVIACNALVYSYFYSAGFRYSSGILDGLFRKSLAYWVNQHSIERISGPFLFQFFTLSWYEHIFVLAFFVQIALFYKKSPFIYKLTGFFSLTLAVFSHLKAQTLGVNSSVFAELLKLKIPLDFYLAFFLIIHSFNVTTLHLKERNRTLAFWGYLFFATFFTYSFVGEKVPWLSLYPLITGIIYLALYFESFTNNSDRSKRFSYSLLALFTLFTLRMNIIVNFQKAGAQTELISQVHTSFEYEKLAYELKDKIKNLKLRSISENVWPLTWYLLGSPNYHFYKTEIPLQDYDLLLNKDYDPLIDRELKETHHKKIIPLRHWWVPDYNKMTWESFFKYALFHEPWNNSGSSNIAYFTKKHQ